MNYYMDYMVWQKYTIILIYTTFCHNILLNHMLYINYNVWGAHPICPNRKPHTSAHSLPKSEGAHCQAKFSLPAPTSKWYFTMPRSILP